MPNEEEAICGDPALAALFNNCRAADNERTCLAEGGHWTRAGLLGIEMCICPTGQGGCSCSDGSDCLSGLCLGEGGLSACRGGPMDGKCSPQTPMFGCFCVVDGGTGVGLCID